MYPIVRLLKDAFKANRMGKLGLLDVHISNHLCWPWDLDIWMELNNGRTFTLFDLGRTMLAVRLGLVPVLKNNKWAIAVAGSTIRYRRRIFAFEPFEMRSRAIGWDDKFFYMEQSIWKRNGECASHALLRTCFTNKKGIVPPTEVVAAWGQADLRSPPLPDWVQAWCDAEDKRPWPPMQNSTEQLARVG
ncbi:MAG: acyl-CoA thioesterase [Epibacterium sp.]|nr:acyl-CoA thioesterase [Epibacterium sp.]NQX73466.1 acyl-CoA thioesterase [Epibacterium sp.]